MLYEVITEIAGIFKLHPQRVANPRLRVGLAGFVQTYLLVGVLDFIDHSDKLVEFDFSGFSYNFV